MPTKENSKCPEDLKPMWLNVARRMQSLSKPGVLSIISINVLVDEKGNPILWTEPKANRIEPKASAMNTLMLLVDSIDDKI